MTSGPIEHRSSRARPAGTPDAPLVSIVTVVYNGVATLERTVQSVLGQTYANIEYIIVDGGSTDGSLEIVRRYEDRIAYWCSGPDGGIYDAMNKGIAKCTGEWVGLINADDMYEPDAVARVVEAGRSHPGTNIVHGDIWILYPNGHRKIKRARPSGFLLRYWEMVLNHPSFFVRRGYYATHPFDAEMRVSGDHQWTLKAWLEDRHQFLYLPIVLATFSAGGASMVMPLSKSIQEGMRMCANLGLGPMDRALTVLVKAMLEIPRTLKLAYNEYVSPLWSRDRS